MTVDDVIATIESAFAGVTLGDGVGLWEAQGRDDYAPPQKLLELRARDEKLDWHRLSPRDLETCHSSLSFFDAAGMRFHLPAFMIAHLRGQTSFDPIFHLTHGDDRRVFALLNDDQRAAVRAYLTLMSEDDADWNP